MQAAACPGGVEQGPLRGTGDFPRPGLPFAPRDPTDVREGTSCGLLARAFSEMQVPAAWSGDLCEEPVTFRGSSEDVREGVEAFGARRKPRFRGNDAWRGDSRSLRGVAADGGPRVRIHLPPAQSQVRTSPRFGTGDQVFRNVRLSANTAG